VPENDKDVLCPRPLEVELQSSEPVSGPSDATNLQRHLPHLKHSRGKRGRL